MWLVSFVTCSTRAASHGPLLAFADLWGHLFAYDSPLYHKQFFFHFLVFVFRLFGNNSAHPLVQILSLRPQNLRIRGYGYLIQRSYCCTYIHTAVLEIWNPVAIFDRKIRFSMPDDVIICPGPSAFIILGTSSTMAT